MKRALLILFCSPRSRPACSRTRCVPPTSSCARPARTPTTHSGRCQARETTCASDSTWSFRRAARTLHAAAGFDGQQRVHRALDREVRGRTDRRHHPHRRPHRDDDGRARAPGTPRRHARRSRGSRRPRPSFVVEAAPRALEVARTYTVLGVEHILTGIDHLLFVLALLIITGGGWRLVKTVTAFTISHSLTLSAATLGFVHVPQRPVEAVIALSIVFVAAEIVRMRRGVDRHHRARAVDRGLHLRADARPGLCGRAERRRAAGRTHSNGAAVLQPGRRVRPFPVHRAWCCR